MAPGLAFRHLETKSENVPFQLLRAVIFEGLDDQFQLARTLGLRGHDRRNHGLDFHVGGGRVQRLVLFLELVVAWVTLQFIHHWLGFFYGHRLGMLEGWLRHFGVIRSSCVRCDELGLRVFLGHWLHKLVGVHF